MLSRMISAVAITAVLSAIAARGALPVRAQTTSVERSGRIGKTGYSRASVDRPATTENPCAPDASRNQTTIVLGPVAGGADEGMQLEQTVAMLPHSGVRSINLHSGIYRLRRPLLLGPNADGLTLQACPGERPLLEAGIGLPVVILQDSHGTALRGLVFVGPASVMLLLDGAVGCVVADGIFLHGKAGIRLERATGNAIVRNAVVGVATTGIELKDGSDGNDIADNAVDGADAPETTGGGIYLHGVRNNRIAHNQIRNTAGFGIGLLNWDDATINIGNVVEYNLLRHTATAAVDSGAIYVLGRSGVDAEVVIAGNVIDGVGAAGNHAVGIYLDDSTSGAVVTRNLVRGIASDAVQIHGGRDNLVENNILDLGAARPSAVLFQAAPADTHPPHAPTGNVVRHNIIVSSNASPKLFVWYDGGSPLVYGNFYVTPDRSLPLPGAPVVDAAPVAAAPELARDAAQDGYRRIEQAAAAIGFRPLDLDTAGVRTPSHP